MKKVVFVWCSRSSLGVTPCSGRVHFGVRGGLLGPGLEPGSPTLPLPSHGAASDKKPRSCPATKTSSSSAPGALLKRSQVFCRCYNYILAIIHFSVIKIKKWEIDEVKIGIHMDCQLKRNIYG